MPRWSRFRLLTALLLAPVAVGCVSDAPNSNSGPVPGFPWVTESSVPQNRGQLKNPSGLDLTYAQWQEQLGNVDEATAGYRRVLTNQPQSLDAMLGLARLEQLAGRPKEAEAAYRKIVQTTPGNARALDALGQFYVAEKRFPEAIPVLKEAVAAAPTDSVCRHHLGVALARAGDTAQALAEFSKAVGEAEAHYNIGYIHYEQGRKDLAEREFLQAVTLRPDLASAQTMLDELRNDRQAQGHSLPAMTRSSMMPKVPMSRPSVLQTAGEHSSDAPRYVAPAAATQHEVATPPSDRPTALSDAQTEWEMPTQRDPVAIYAEQMQSQPATH